MRIKTEAEFIATLGPNYRQCVDVFFPRDMKVFGKKLPPDQVKEMKNTGLASLNRWLVTEKMIFDKFKTYKGRLLDKD